MKNKKSLKISYKCSWIMTAKCKCKKKCKINNNTKIQKDSLIYSAQNIGK